MKTILTNLVNSSKVLNTFINLKYRWEDEKMYENFNDYAEVMIQSIKKEIDNVHSQMEVAEREMDLSKLSELKFGRLPELEKQLQQQDTQMTRLKTVLSL